MGTLEKTRTRSKSTLDLYAPPATSICFPVRQNTQSTKRRKSSRFDELWSYGLLLMDMIGVALIIIRIVILCFRHTTAILHVMLKRFGSPSLRRFTRSYANDVDVIHSAAQLAWDTMIPQKSCFFFTSTFSLRSSGLRRMLLANILMYPASWNS